MDLVVVYLTKVRRHIIIPEKYIYGFNLKALKNYGKNPSRDQLIYWSEECIEGEHYPDPDINATVSENWPAQAGAWFHGRTIYYTDDFEEAKKIKESRRRICPGVYNSARLREPPLPLLVLEPNIQQQQQQSDDERSIVEDEQQQQPQSDDDNDDGSIAEGEQPSNLNISSVSLTEEPAIANDSHRSDGEEEIAQNSSVDPLVNVNNLIDETNIQTNQSQPEMEQTFDHDFASQSNCEQQELIGAQQGVEALPNQNEASPNRDVPIEINMATMNPIPTDDATPTTSNSAVSEANASIKPEPVFVHLLEDSAKAVDDVLNESFELCDDSGDVMIHSKSADLMPLPFAVRNPYEVKQHDIISGNLPYATNDAGDRAYIVYMGGKWKQLSMPIRVVKGLKGFNMGGFRSSVDYDKKFVKVLLVACNGIDKSKNSILDPFVGEFIHDLFRIRCEGEVENDRMKSLHELIKVCCDELAAQFK
ncbi:uncharacterized protein LOC129575768 [Sitodiplosis mosellana]|uniref:uncharacterized protein LOC129575768 n=1 Tax=Sitodiplosis mosellana TaxID=263140 RepID=UPI0024453458|nr:uncharacterized protein LOC129575768 [Sitodiplosis mosellana]